jgi:hypothetical protein
MLILGEWQLFDDDVTRPLVRAKVRGNDEHLVTDDFLIDSGADRIVFSVALLAQLHLPTTTAPPGFTLSGVGRTSEFVLVTTVMEFVRDDGGSV